MLLLSTCFVRLVIRASTQCHSNWTSNVDVFSELVDSRSEASYRDDLGEDVDYFTQVSTCSPNSSTPEAKLLTATTSERTSTILLKCRRVLRTRRPQKRSFPPRRPRRGRRLFYSSVDVFSELVDPRSEASYRDDLGEDVDYFTQVSTCSPNSSTAEAKLLTGTTSERTSTISLKCRRVLRTRRLQKRSFSPRRPRRGRRLLLRRVLCEDLGDRVAALP